jgi:hypothetical protein
VLPPPPLQRNVEGGDFLSDAPLFLRKQLGFATTERPRNIAPPQRIDVRAAVVVRRRRGDFQLMVVRLPRAHFQKLRQLLVML